MKFRIGSGRRRTTQDGSSSRSQQLRQRKLGPGSRMRHEPVSRNPRGRGQGTLSRPVRIAAISGLFLLALAIGIATSSPVSQATASWWLDAPVRIRSIAVTGLARLDVKQVADASGLLPGEFFENLNPVAVADDLRSHPWIRSARVATLPSGELLIRIEERHPRASLHARSDGPGIWVDPTGVPFAQGDDGIAGNPSPLRLIFPEPLAMNRPSPRVRDAIALHDHWLAQAGESSRLNEIQLPVPGDPEGWILRTRAADLEVVLGAWGSPEALSTLDRRFEQLRRVLEADLTEGPLTGRIDLRFKDQAIWIADVHSKGG